MLFRNKVYVFIYVIFNLRSIYFINMFIVIINSGWNKLPVG